jgi:hypothetical protein
MPIAAQTSYEKYNNHPNTQNLKAQDDIKSLGNGI